MSGAQEDTSRDDGRPMPVVLRAGARPFPPRVSSFTRPFWDALGQGRLTTTACGDCGRLSFPPKPLCRGCWSRAMTWRELKPAGVLYSCTHVHVVPGAFVADAPGGLGCGLVVRCHIEKDPQWRGQWPELTLVNSCPITELFGHRHG